MVKSTLVEQTGQVETGEAGEALRAYLRDVVRDTIAGVMAEEVVALCGPRHVQGQHANATFVRGGSAVGWCVVDGKKERIVHPRVRERAGDATREKVLHSYAAAKDADEVRRQILLCYSNGVSTRSMSDVLPGAPGTSRSEISRQWQVHGTQALEKLRLGGVAQRRSEVLDRRCDPEVFGAQGAQHPRLAGCRNTTCFDRHRATGILQPTCRKRLTGYIAAV